MILQTILYNVVMLVVGVRLARRLRERRTASAATGSLAVVWSVGLVLAVAFSLGLGRFGAMRLFAYGLFGHGAIAAMVAAAHLRSGWQRALGATLSLSLVAVAVFAFLVEPYRLEVTHVRLESSKLSTPLRIALMADFQTDHIGEYERRVLEATMASAPDLILMAGDYLHIADESRRREVRGDLLTLLHDVDFGAPLGVIAVAGNIDRADWPQSFEGLPVTVVEKRRRVEVRGDVTVTALGVWESFDPELVVERADGFHVVLGHAPDYALGRLQADLLLAGHTHGGQVRLPGIGPLLTLSRVPRAWASGTTPLDGLDGDRTLIVSRGIGMERSVAPRLRFLCRPELVVIDVVPRSTMYAVDGMQ